VIGMDRPIRPARLTHAELKAFADAYAQGSSIRALAAAHGMSYGAMHLRLSIAQTSGLVSIRAQGSHPAVND